MLTRLVKVGDGMACKEIVVIVFMQTIILRNTIVKGEI